MNIRREKPCHRRHHRVSTPLRININGRAHPANDWSIGGIQIGEWEGPTQVGDRLNCEFGLPFQGFNISFIVEIEVIRLIPDCNAIGCSFVNLSERQKSLLSHFIDELVRGSMTPVEDTILRIDSPVTPISTKPDPNPNSELPLRRLPTKTIAMSCFYLSFGFCLLFYIGLTLYANFFTLEVESAVVSAPIEQLVASTDGRIQKISVSLGTMVNSGDRLIVLEDARIEEKISVAKVRIDRAKVELEQVGTELALERAKLIDYRGLANSRLAQAEAVVRGCREKRDFASKQVKRFAKLLGKGFIPRHEYDAAVATNVQWDVDLRKAEISVSSAGDMVDAVARGRYFTGLKFEGQSGELAAEVGRLDKEVTLATQELRALYEHRERLVLKAPTPGRLLKMLKSEGSRVSRGETIALFERDEQRVIQVFLTQQEILHIGIGSKAHVYFPALDTVAITHVIAADRTAGYIDEVESRYDWHGATERTARVTLAFENISAHDMRQQFTPGLPAIVVFRDISIGVVGDFIRRMRTQTIANITRPQTQEWSDDFSL